MFILSRYLVKHVSLGIMLVWLFIAVIIGLLDFVEIFTRAADNPHSDLGLVLKITLLKWPGSLQRLLPFAILFGTALALLRLRHGNELIIIFVSGMRQRSNVFLIGLVGFAFGLLSLLCDGLVAQSQSSYRFYEYNVLALARERTGFNQKFSHLQFYYRNEQAHHYINLARVNVTENILRHVHVTLVDRDTGHLMAHIFTKQGKITDEGWLFPQAQLYRPKEEQQILTDYLLPLRVNLQDLAISARKLDTIGFFSLPEFIQLANNTGLQTSIYTMQFWQKLITPFLFASFAALALGIVRLTPPRKSMGWVLLKCFLWALGLIFSQNLIGTLGGAESLSIGAAVFAQLALSTGIASMFLMQPGIR